MKNLINQKYLFLLLVVVLTYSCSNKDFYVKQVI